MTTGVNLNQYFGPGSHIPWHSDSESLFGPQNQPELIVSVSLGHSVEFQVRRAWYRFPSPIKLDHGDLLVMNGPAQPEYEHRTVSGLQGPRIPMGHTTRCVLSTSRSTCRCNVLCSALVRARFSRAGFPSGGMWG